jgi:hypothetical protein
MITKFKEYQLLLEKFEDNQIKKIKTFCNVPEIYNWAVEFSPKLSVWLSNVIKNLIIEKSDLDAGFNNNPIEQKKSLDKFFKGEKIEYIDETLFKRWIVIFTQNREYLNQYTTILDWIRSPLRTENVDISKLTLDEAYKKSVEWHKNLVASGVVANEEGIIFMTFSDGYYWIDLESSSCRDEADAMGHCGNTNADTLLSLRNRQEPHVTIAYDYDGKIFQAKGKNNTKPVDKYHKYIVELLCYPNVSEGVKLMEVENSYKITGFEYEYEPQYDFKIKDLTPEQIKYVYERNPEIFTDFSLKYYLFKSKIITKEQLMENNPYKDLIFIYDDIYMFLGEWTDIECYKSDRNHTDGWEIKILNGEGEWNYDQISFDYSNWDELNQDAYNSIKSKIVKDGISISVNDTEKEKEYELLLTDKNCIVTEKDILVKLKFKKTVSLGDLLNDESYDEDGLEIQSDELDEIRDDMSWGNTSAQEGADQSEAYNDIIKGIQDVIGYAKKENGQKVWHKREDGSSGYLIDVDLDLISELSQMEEGEGCDTVVDLFNSALPYYNDGDDCIDVSEPQYGWSGNVTGEDLSTCIESRMS